MKLVGAVCKTGNKIELSDEVQTDLNLVQFWWTRESAANDSVPIPVYLYSNRANNLFCFDFVPDNVDAALLNERGVAVICN